MNTEFLQSVNKYFFKLRSGMSKSPFYGVKPWERKYKSVVEFSILGKAAKNHFRCTSNLHNTCWLEMIF